MTASQPGTRSFASTLALGLALIGAASMLYYEFGLLIPRAREVSAANRLKFRIGFGGDFYPVWLTSRECLIGHHTPYSSEITQEIQIGLFGRPLDVRRSTDPADLRMFAHPAFTILLFWPMAELPFTASRVVLAIMLVSMTFASVLFWIRALSCRLPRTWLVCILLLAITSYPALEGLYAVQLGILVSFLLAFSVVAMQRGRLLLAGTLMALSTIKPQVTVFAIFYFIIWSLYDWRRRGLFLVGLFSTLLVLSGASFAVWPHWTQSWTHTVLAYRHYSRPPLVTEVLTSSLGPQWASPATFILTAAAIIAAIVLAWRNRAAASSSYAFCITLSLLLAITTITILAGQAVYDHLILLPGILLLARSWRELCNAGTVPRILVPLGALVLFWPWISAFALIILRPLIAPAIFDSTPVFALPIRTAASLPFAVLALLAWALRVNPAGEMNQASPQAHSCA